MKRVATASRGFDLEEWIQAECYDDPLAFVLGAYPWGEPGTMLANHAGPDTWQIEFLKRLRRHVKERAFDGHTAVMPVRMAASKGHGVGGSVMAAWVVDWIMSTRPHCQGTVTANTSTQLDTKTWAAIMRWSRLCITRDWFTLNTERMYRIGHRDSWFCTPQTCQEQNSEAFAGQHAADSTSFYINDEASAIPEEIWTVEEGGLTDGEPMQFAFGNATRSTGTFHKVCFGSLRNRWDTVVVDSRTSRFSNKELIAQWAEDHGEDSDFFRVRVLGLPPNASDIQFIDNKRVQDAQAREVHPLEDDPLVCGLDIARGGADSTVFRFRRGPDGRSIPPIRIPGEKSRDSMQLVTKATTLLDDEFDGRKIEMLFIDCTGVGGPIYDRLVQLGYEKRVFEVQFGSESPDPHFANLRAYMWAKTRDWLPRAAIDRSPELEADLTGPEYDYDKKDRLILEPKDKMKERGLASPDDGDALCMTFTAPAVARIKARQKAKARERFAGRSSRRDTGLGWLK